MPRDPVVGDRALTGAERQAHQRAKAKAKQQATQQELQALRCVSWSETEAQEAAGTHRLVWVSVLEDSGKWWVFERDRDGRSLYRRDFATEAEAAEHGYQRLMFAAKPAEAAAKRGA